MDTTFGAGGRTDAGNAFAKFTMTSDDRIVGSYLTSLPAADATSDPTPVSTIVRYTPDGQADTTFGSSGAVVIPTPTSSSNPAVPISQPDGKILIETLEEDSSSYWLSRLDQIGNIDDAFGRQAVAGTRMYYVTGAVAQQRRVIFTFSTSMPANLITPNGQLVVISAFQI